MAIQGFDTNYFVEELFKHAQTNYPQWAKGKTVDNLKADLRVWYPEAKSLDDAAEQFYTEFGVKWGLAPNKYFNPAEYRQAWAEKQATTHLTSVADALVAYDAEVSGEDYKGDAYDHYLKEGAAMGVNPSNDFDESSYLETLITIGDGLDEFTPKTLRAVAIKAGVTPLSFFIDNENPEYDVDAIPVPEGERVDTNIIIPDDTDYDQTFTLTPGIDTWNGGKGRDVVRGVAGQSFGSQDQTTLNSSDVLDGGTDADTLVVLLNGNYGGGATVSNFETIQIGTNNTAPVAFDYNVNAGKYEIVNTNTILADQITTGETLNINNITPTAVGNIGPALHWENEVGSGAGTVGLTYRTATTNGTSTNQDITLQNVSGGTLNIAGGVEQITINSAGSVPNNFLLNTAVPNLDSATTFNNLAADLVSNGSLTKVVLTGSTAIGREAGVPTPNTSTVAIATVTLTGLTDRTVGVDTGNTTGIINVSSASDLLSVGSRVTNVDASAMTASANVRFAAKANGSASNVSFTGGSANDYVEFELGNVTAAGGAGDDVFSFINARTNSTFGESDVLNGNAGTDVIQIGLNGVGTYNISQTELRNKTSIETLDLRGAITNLTLSSEFVAASDTSDITIYTDRIVRSIAADGSISSLNSQPTYSSTSVLEDISVNTANLTFLNGSQAVNYNGGTGSDRLILNDANFNVLQTLNGGAFDSAYASRNAGAGAAVAAAAAGAATAAAATVAAAAAVAAAPSSAAVAAAAAAAAAAGVAGATAATVATAAAVAVTPAVSRAAAGRYDTLTVVTNGENVVLDAQDTSRVSNFNGMILTKNSSAATYTIDLNNAFLNANTAAIDDIVNTTLDDRAFVFGTAAAANNSALSAGDTIRFNLDGLSGTPTSRCFDLTSLVAAGVTVQFVQSGVTYTNTLAGTTGGVSGYFAGIAGATSTTTANVAALGNTGRADVIASAAIPAPVGVGSTLVTTGSGFSTTSGFLIQNNNQATALDDNLVINTLTDISVGAPTINLGANAIGTPGDTMTINPLINVATPNIALAAGVETLILAGGSSVNVTGAAGMNITANAPAIFTLVGAGSIGNGSTGSDNITASALGSIINGNGGNDTINDGAGIDIITVSGTGNNLITAGSTAAADNITVSSTGTNIIAFPVFVDASSPTVTLGGGIDNIIINEAALTNNDLGSVIVTGFSAADSLTLGVAGAGISNGIFYDNATAIGAALGTGAVVELNGTGANAYNYLTANNTAALLTHFINTMGATSNVVGGVGATITAVAYNSAGTAAVYAVGDTNADRAFDSVELVGVLNGVGINALVSANFA